MSARAAGSIHQRLLVRLSLSLLLLSVLMASGLYWFSWQTANRAFDRALLGAALAIADRVVVDDDSLWVDLPYVALEMLSASAEERVYYRVTDSEGGFVTGYEHLPEPALQPWREARVEGEWFYDANFLQQPVRVAVIARIALGGTDSRPFLVFVSETTNNRRALALRLLSVFVGGMSVLAVAVLFVVWTGLRWGLAPLGALSRALQRRTAADLHPISEPVPQELVPVEQSINQLLERVARNQAEQKRFVEDASHQLRTPLAALKAQLSLALDASSAPLLRADLIAAQQTLERSIRLSKQLLSHARVIETGRWAKLDFTALVADVCRQWVPAALTQKMDLGFDDRAASVTIVGDELLLQEMLRNLLENAICYGQADMLITVSVDNESGRVRLSVMDTGAAIDAEASVRLFDRFYRPPGSNGSGSGLGLAIVRSIAQLHHGEAVYKKMAPGNAFIVTLPSVPLE